jgi:hypothetical protein
VHQLLPEEFAQEYQLVVVLKERESLNLSMLDDLAKLSHA